MAVVLGDSFAVLDGDTEGERARSRGRRGEAHRNGGRLTVVRQLHVLRADDLAVVLDDEGHGPSPVPRLRHDDVDDERSAQKHGSGGLHPAELDVAIEALPPDADRIDGNALGLKGEQRLAELVVGVVGSVSHEYQARERHRSELGSSQVQGGTEPCAATREAELRDVVEAVSAGRETEEPNGEPVRQSLEKRRLGVPEILVEERAPSTFVDVLDSHALRVVEQNAHEVLLRDDRRDHERGAEQADRYESEAGHAEDAENQPVDRPRLSPDPHVGQHRGNGHDCHREDARGHRAIGPKGDVAFLEDDQAVLEQELE